MQIKTKKVENFTPFTVEITFESESEANNFWHRMNVANEVIAQHNEGYEFFEADHSELWEHVDVYYKPKPKTIEDAPKTFEYRGTIYQIVGRLDAEQQTCSGCDFQDTYECPDDSIFDCVGLKSIAVEVTS